MPDESSFDAQTSTLPPTCLTVLYFHAPWAEPCKQMTTILTTLASTYTSTIPPRIAFFSLDAEEVSDVSERYDVTQVPLVVLQKGGQVVDSITGTDAGKVRSAVEKHVGGGKQSGLPPAQKVTRPPEKEPVQTQEQEPATNGASAETSEQELNTRLSELVKAAPVMLFMKGKPSAPECGFSRQTVALLREKGVRYGFFNILADDEVRQGLKAFWDWPTFPQVYAGGELVGGLDIVSGPDKLLRRVRNTNRSYSSKKSSKTTQTSSKNTRSTHKRRLPDVVTPILAIMILYRERHASSG